MREDDGSSDCFDAPNEGVLPVTRREFVGGIATTVVIVSSDLKAEEAKLPPAPVRAIRDPDCPQVIGVEVQDPGAKDAAAPKWQLFAKTLGGDGRPHLLPPGNPASTGFLFDNAALFTDSPIALECRFFADGPESGPKVWMIEATLKSIPMSDSVIAAAVDLSQFLAGKVALTFDIGAEATARLAKAWFGPRIEFDSGAGARIAFWKDRPLEVTPAQRAIWAFNSAVKLSKLLLSRVATGEGEGAAIRIAGKQATSDNDWTLLGEAKEAAWISQSAAVYDVGRAPKTRIILSAKSERPDSVVFRRAGDPLETLAILRGRLTAKLASLDAEAPTCEFDLEDALLLRRSVKVTPSAPPPPRDLCGPSVPGNSARSSGEQPPTDLFVTLRGRLSPCHFNIETVYGGFEIAGDPLPAKLVLAQPALAQPAALAKPVAGTSDVSAATVNPLDLAALPERGLTHLVAEARNEELASLDVRGLLTHMSIVVPERSRNDMLPRASDTTWSRLDFDGTEIALCLASNVAHARVSGARGIVTLGEKARLLANGQFPPVSVALDGARLKLRRASDNLALSLQFRRLVLELGLNEGRIAPNARIGMMDAGLAPDVGTDARLRFDDRPLLIAHFPPQHVAERAYYRIVNDGTTLPEPPRAVSSKTTGQYLAKLEMLRTQKPADRQAYQKELKDEAQGLLPPPGSPKSTNPLVVAAESYHALTELLKKPSWADDLSLAKEEIVQLQGRWNGFPADQKIYLGAHPLAIDPDVRSITLTIWRAFRRKQDETPLSTGSPDFPKQADQLFNDRLRQLPGGILPADVVAEVTSRSPNNNSMMALETEKRKRDEDYTRVQSLYQTLAQRKGLTDNAATRSAATYSGQAELRAVYESLKSPADKKLIVDLLKDVLDELRKLDDSERFPAVTPARLSGPSRLVFRVDSNEERPFIPFTFDGLTDWGAFDLAVMRRAETVERLIGDRLPNAAFRTPESNAESILAFQNIRPGRSIDGRLADIRASLFAPGPTETSIELPFRLSLSPDQFGRFRTRRPVPQQIFSDGHASTIEPHLWSANLDATQGASKLRAVWSPDFRPEAFGQSDQAPAPGPSAPWEAVLEGQKPSNFRTALDAYDRHEIVALSSVYGMPVLGRRAETLSIADSSQFEPPPAYKLRGLKKYSFGGNTDLSSIYNPQSLTWTELRLTALGGSLSHDTQFVPPAAALREKNGTPLFDAFSIERWRQVTVLGRDIQVEVVYKGYLFPLGIRASLVKVTERQFLRNPASGHITAFLIQRKFIRIGQPEKQFPVAGQPNQGVRFPVSQLKLTTLTTPDILDPDADSSGGVPQDFFDNTMALTERPAGRLDIEDKRTAKAPTGRVFWPRTRPGQGGNVQFQFTVNSEAVALSMPLLFVDNTVVNKEAVLGTIAAYYNAEENIALRTVSHYGASRRYAEEIADGECHFETQNWVIQAEGRAGKGQLPGTGRISPETESTHFENDPLLEGAEQPPFYPFLEKCTIRIGQAERFVGHPLDAKEARYLYSYRDAGGFQSRDPDGNPRADPDGGPPERYLLLSQTLKLSMDQAGDRSGGMARPEMDISILSRKHGPVGGATRVSSSATSGASAAGPVVVAAASPAAAAPPPFDWKSFFNGDAKLLGLITFADLLRTAAGSAPELKERVDTATEGLAETIKKQILPILLEAVDFFDQSWTRAQAALGGKLDLATIYPEIKPALEDLRNRLVKASTAPSADLVYRLTEVQQSGRRFVTVIERTAADPIAPMQASIRDQFRALAGTIVDLGSDFQNRVATARRDITKTLTGTLLDLIKINPKAATLFFPLPVPVPNPATGPAIARDLDDIVVEAASEFVLRVISGSSAEEAVKSARMRALEIFDDKIRARTQSGQAVILALNRYKTQLQDVADTETARVTGFAGDTLVKAVAALNTLDAIVATGGRDLLSKIGGKLDAVVAAIANLLVDQAVQRAFSNAAAWCQTQLGHFERFAATGLPPPNQLTDLVANLRLVVALFNDPGGTLNPPLEKLASIAKSYADTYVQVPTAGAAAAACAAFELAPFYALRGLLDLRRQAMGTLEGLYGALGNHPLTGGDGAALTQLRIVRDQTRNLIPSSAAALQPMRAAITNFVDVKPTGGAARDLAIQARATNAGAQLKSYADGAEAAAKALIDINETIAVKFSAKLASEINSINTKGKKTEDDFIEVLTMMLVSAQPLATSLTTAIANIVQPSFGLLLAVYSAVHDARVEASAKIYPAAGASSGKLAQILALLLSSKGRQIAGNIFVVPRRPPSSNETIASDALTDELGQLQRLTATTLVAPDVFLDDVLGLASAWKDGDPALLRLVQNVGDVVTAVLRGDIAQFIDLQQVREKVDTAIRQMVPARIVRSYDLKTALQDIGQTVTFRADRPNPKTQGKDLVVRATGVVDLIEPRNSTAEAIGYLPGFDLRLLPAIGIDVATLTFAPSTFYAAPGKPFTFSLKIEDVKLGSAVKFLQELQAFISSPKNGSGFYLRAMVGAGRFGIVAGYGLALGPISIGNVYISHLSLNCAAELPLDSGDARFVISIGRPEAPFIVSAAPYAGAGYLGFIANAKGIVGFEASMQYGGGGGFAFGPLTGEGRISVGIYIRTYLGHTELYGLFFAGGSAQIACFSCSTSLLVRLTQSGGNLSGDATFTFSFSMGIRDIEFAVTVYKEQQGSGDKEASLQNSVPSLTRFARGFAPGRYAELTRPDARSSALGRTTISDATQVAQGAPGTSSGSVPSGPVLHNKTTCKGVDYRVYRDYFAYPGRPPVAAAAAPLAVPAPAPTAPSRPVAKSQPAPKNAPAPLPSTVRPVPAETPPPRPPGSAAGQAQAQPWLFL